MRLLDLEPEWLFKYDHEKHSMWRAEDIHTTAHAPHADGEKDLPDLAVAEAQGVMFLCPVCFAKNGGPVGTESVLCWFKGRGIPDDAIPGPGRWTASGTSFADLTLSPSVNVANEHWHGFITNGEVK